MNKGITYLVGLVFFLAVQFSAKTTYGQLRITSCYCMPHMEYGPDGWVYLDQNKADDCNYPINFLTGQIRCSPASTDYSFYHRYQNGFTEHDFTVSSPENNIAVQYTQNTSRNDITSGWEYVYYAQFYLSKTYVGRFSVKSAVYPDLQTIDNICMLKKTTDGAFGIASLAQGTTISSSGLVNLDFKWTSDIANYCDEVFNPEVGGQIQIVENGVGRGWFQTIRIQNADGSVSFKGLNAAFNVSGFGPKSYVVQIHDRYGNYYSTPALNINIVPSCFSEVPKIKITSLEGGQVRPVSGGYNQGDNSFAPGGYELDQGKLYEINMTDNTQDYCQFYQTIINDGTTTAGGGTSCLNTTCNINTSVSSSSMTLQPVADGVYRIRINDPIGYYALYGKRKLCLGTNCSDFKILNLMVGGRNMVGSSPCLINLPDDLTKVFPDLTKYAANQAKSFILHNFVYSVTSSQGIIVRSVSNDPNYPYSDGIILQDGAILKIEDVYVQPLAEQVDNNKNWTQDWFYDDEGQVIGEHKQFYNEQGAALQTQVKSLSKEMVLAAEPIYDKFGRPVINTLSAPIRYKETTAAVEQCGSNIRNGANMYFIYNGNFSAGYNFTNFDTYAANQYLASENYSAAHPISNAKEDAPDNLQGQGTEQTLAWYYGANNIKTSLSSLKEPYVASSLYPYSRTLFYSDGTAELKGSTIPGDAFKAGGGFVPEQKIKALEASDDNFLNAYYTIYTTNVFPALSNPISYTNFKANLYKVSYKDVEGKESIVYKNKNGQTIASIYVPTSDKTCQFYNSLGQLVCSISPNGMKQLLIDGQLYSAIDKSTYTYNVRGWVVEVNELDAGTSKYMYRKDGNIRFSQHAEQLLNNKFSYTTYDKIGRPVESGEFTPSNTNLYFGQVGLKAILENTADNDGLTSGTRSDQVITYYDVADAVDPNAPQGQTFTNGKVSYTVKPGEAKTWYSYDERGRVIWTAHYIAGLTQLPEKYKTVEYRYDNSGNVLEVAYNRGQSDQFYHVYRYDKDSRLAQVYTATTPVSYNAAKQPDLTNLSIQATYEYYNHGPLKRVELGNKLQGIDYVYTVQGWLKAVNNYNKTQDPGTDNTDVFGMSLEYYSGDYNNKVGNVSITTPTGITVPEYHNGNIKAMNWFTEKPQAAPEPVTPTTYQYQYDTRNQFTQAQFGNINSATSAVAFTTAASEGNITYDANGNMQSLKRYSADGSLMHDFTAYNYQGNTNKLTSITGYNETYAYNTIGQLKSTTNTSTNALRYNQYDARGMVTNVSKDASGTQPLMQAHYNDNGLRYKKESYDPVTGNLALTTYYMYDAAGNVLAVYSKTNASLPAQVQEYNVYGSDRIGQYRLDGNSFINVYELQDHLGSTRALVWKNSVSNQLEVLSYQDYYPYGLSMRGYEQNYSRYNTYQGQYAEKDPETEEENFQFRSYVSAIGRWFGPDHAKQHYSAYLAMGNNPVSRIDPDGLTDFFYDQMGNELPALRISNNLPDRHFMAHSQGTYFHQGNKFIQVNSAKSIIDNTDPFVFKYPHDGLFELEPGAAGDLVSMQLNKVYGMGDFALQSRQEGALDFKRMLPQNKLIGINGVYYSRPEAGNYLWGAAARAYGFSYQTTKRAADLYSNFNNGQPDAKNEVDAYTRGFNQFGNFIRNQSMWTNKYSYTGPRTPIKTPRYNFD